MDPKMRALVDSLLRGYQPPSRGEVLPVRIERRVRAQTGPGAVSIESRTADPLARQLALGRLLLGRGANAGASAQSVED